MAALNELKKIGDEYLTDATNESMREFISHNLDVERTFACLKRLDLRRNSRTVSNLEASILFRENIVDSEEGRAFYDRLTPNEHRRIRKITHDIGPLRTPEKLAHQEALERKRKNLAEMEERAERKKKKEKELDERLLKLLLTSIEAIPSLNVGELKDQLKKVMTLVPDFKASLSKLCKFQLQELLKIQLPRVLAIQELPEPIGIEPVAAGSDIVIPEAVVVAPWPNCENPLTKDFLNEMEVCASNKGGGSEENTELPIDSINKAPGSVETCQRSVAHFFRAISEVEIYGRGMRKRKRNALFDNFEEEWPKKK